MAGNFSKLHQAVSAGSTERTLALLESGQCDIDGLGHGKTPLMWSATDGYSRVTRILLNKGADVSAVGDGDFTALHQSALAGHLAVTKMLVKAGADLEAKSLEGVTPLFMAADCGRSEVVGALIKAGADIDSRKWDGGTPLFVAAQNGHMDAVMMLLRAGANPRLAFVQGPYEILPLDMAAQSGRVGATRELIRQVGIEGCGGETGGKQALCAAARGGHVNILAILTDAGVVDAGGALRHAAGYGHEAAVKFLLQQKGRSTKRYESSYVNNSTSDCGQTAMVCAIGFVEMSISPYPRIVRLLVDAGADTASTLRVTDAEGTVLLDETLLAGTTRLIREKKVGTKDATGEHLNKLEEIRRLLQQVGAVHAVSFLWPSNASSSVRTAEGTGTAKTIASRPVMKLPLLRRSAGARRKLLTTLFKHSQKLR